MRKMKPALVAATAGFLAMGLGSAGLMAEDYGPFKAEKTKMGEVLASPKGMTLYTFDKDKGGMSACTGKCADFWPPVMATASDKPMGDFTIIKREDGSMQWAYDGKPLYLYKDDKKAGDMMGDGKNGVWHVVKAED